MMGSLTKVVFATLAVVNFSLLIIDVATKMHDWLRWAWLGCFMALMFMTAFYLLLAVLSPNKGRLR